MKLRKELAPAQDQPSPETTITNVSQSTSALPTPERTEDFLDAAVLAAAEERGYRLACRCTKCGSWLVARKSVIACMGPVCRRREAGVLHGTS